MAKENHRWVAVFHTGTGTADGLVRGTREDAIDDAALMDSVMNVAERYDGYRIWIEKEQAR